MERPQAESRKRCRGDAGTALVELALVITPLCMILFGILIYGYLMSFRQNMTQAATEGARAGAVAPADSTPHTFSHAIAAAMNATDDAVHSFGASCGSGGYECRATVDESSGKPLITVEVIYHYADHPLMPPVPIVTNFIPSTFTSRFTAQVNQ